MTPDEILSYPARVLTQEQRKAYFDKGFVNVDEIVPADILKSLQDTTQDFVEQSKSDDRLTLTQITARITPCCGALNPRIRQVMPIGIFQLG